MKGMTTVQRKLSIALSAGAFAGLALAAAPAASAEPGPSGTPTPQIQNTQAPADGQAKSAVKGKNSPVAGCWFKADKPFPVSYDVRSQSRIKNCFGRPTACYMNSYLEKYHPGKHQWYLVAANRKGWGSCKAGRKVIAKYRCGWDRHFTSYYHTVTVALASKNGNNGNVGKAVSKAFASHCH
ncbi:hypothetical protein [Actinomadura rubrisoli]|uniref:Uncharacterized protein n=1 Tax=Actinomadura rubrisoli TaxID=2530368 RepID=A0A4R5BFM6_9ACTN|nr:hypothetical protein [Actinomadura rubrisoli]TDD85161.1 hypothetical protein E1298_19065 [Actinomadura rubrisoli]